jgi:ribonuclease G
MTRQNVTDGPREVMTKKCPTCGGDGIVVSEQTAAVAIERKLRELAAPGSRTQAYRVELNARIADLVIGPAARRLTEIEESAKRRFFFERKDDVHLDHFLVTDQGSLAKLRPDGPEEGSELEVKLGEVGRYDATAGVGKLDGIDVHVAGAAKLVGKKVKIRIVRVLDGSAYAELLKPVEKTAEPITAEGEAEKPTRAARTKKRAAEPVPETEIEIEAEPESVVAEEQSAAEEAEEAAAAPAKKRTRRGTRGGRKRKKKPVADTESQPAPEELGVAEAESPEREADEEPPAPKIHVPDEALGRGEEESTPATPRKRTRRGSRGGRRRKRPAAAAAVDGAAVAGAPQTTESETSSAQRGGQGDDSGWEYVPMSEWDEDIAGSA